MKVIHNPKKCKGFFPYDTDDFMNDPLADKNATKKIKRKNYTAYEREMIYRKGNCKCYLCGKELLISAASEIGCSAYCRCNYYSRNGNV